MDEPHFDFDPVTSSLTRRKMLPPSGSVRSTRSLRGLSIFEDPEASRTMPRDVEITLNMYDDVTEKVDDVNDVASVEYLPPAEVTGASERRKGYFAFNPSNLPGRSSKPETVPNGELDSQQESVNIENEHVTMNDVT